MLFVELAPWNKIPLSNESRRDVLKISLSNRIENVDSHFNCGTHRWCIEFLFYSESFFFFLQSLILVSKDQQRIVGQARSISFIDQGIKHHRDRGHHHRNDEESLLDKQERERDKKDRKKDDDDKKGTNTTRYLHYTPLNIFFRNQSKFNMLQMWRWSLSRSIPTGIRCACNSM